MVDLTLLPPVIVVLAAAFIMPRLPRGVGHAIGVIAAGIVVPWSLLVPAGPHLAVQFLGFDVVLFNVDGFSRLMGIIFGLIGAGAVAYSYHSAADRVQTGYALAYVATSIGAVYGGDWLTLVFFWELMAVSSTLLVWHHGGRAIRPGFRYAIAHGIGGSLLMAAAIWHYVAAGSFLFDGGIATGPASLLAALGIGVNVAFIGLHTWLPDTYPSPHIAASVFLSVYSTKTGVYAMARAFPEGQLWIAYMGGAMAVFGAFVALLQNDMRRLLSYHIQSQVGYMVAGVGIGTALATAGGMAHVYNHILYKSLLFMTAGVIIYRTGHEDLKKLGGLAREMPITAIAFTIAALSIAGFPGFNGFVSKGMVVAAAHKEHLDALWWLLILGGVGTFLSFIKFGYYAFLHGPATEPVRDANRGQSVVMLGVAGLCVLYGVYPDALFSILPGTGAAEAHPFTIGHILEGLGLAAAGLIGFVLIRKPLSRVGRVRDVDAVYTRVLFYGTRALVFGLTDLYAAVDRAVVGGTRAVIEVVNQPQAAIRRVLGDDVLPDPDEDRLALQAGVGFSMLLVVVVLVALLVLLF